MKKNLKQLVMVLILAIMIFPASVRAEGNNCFGDDLKGADQEAFSTLIDEIQCIKEAHPEFNDERILEIIDQNHTKFERGIMLRINELMNYSDEIQSGKQSIGRFESISLKNVTFKYLGSNEPDLKGINITIKRGEKIAIVGESGSGKTTISKLLLNALTKYEGEILLNGYNINSIKREAIDHIFTIVTQVPMAISGTIRDNIDISHDLSDDEIYSCLKTAELENDVNKFPMKLNTFVGENGQNISGGQKQRIAIARALALKPEVLILDEATSNLDPITERKICDNLKKLHITQIIITHRLSQVEDADMIYVLNHGEIMEKGSHEQLMKGKGLYSKLVRIA